MMPTTGPTAIKIKIHIQTINKKQKENLNKPNCNCYKLLWFNLLIVIYPSRGKSSIETEVQFWFVSSNFRGQTICVYFI